jgi:hypothetical protein
MKGVDLERGFGELLMWEGLSRRSAARYFGIDQGP